MHAAILGFLAETSLHPGTGQVTDVIDLPVAREKTTSYPVIVGSSLKGALRDRAEQVWGYESEPVMKVFGKHENAGAVAVSDARLLLLPVRCLNGHFKWVTCPYLLERYRRDRQLAGMPVDLPLIPEPNDGQAAEAGEGILFLEELSFNVVPKDMTPLAAILSPLVYHQNVQERLASALVVISDNDFAHFVRYGLAVNARNVLDDKKKTSKNLWYEETVPPESLFYALLLERAGQEQQLEALKGIFADRPYLQVGGNETVGQGWCAVTWLGGGEEQ